MTPDERDLLDRALADLDRARPAQKDPEAARRIDRAVRDNPDAAYVLVQHAVLSDQALQAAERRIAELEDALHGDRARGEGGGGLFGGLFGGGRRDDDRFDRGRPGWGGSAVPPTHGHGRGYERDDDRRFGGGGGGPFTGGGMGGFLRQAGVAAAGVAGGAFLYQGLSNMFGGGDEHDRQGLFGGGGEEEHASGAHDLFDDGGGDGDGGDWG